MSSAPRKDLSSVWSELFAIVHPGTSSGDFFSMPTLMLAHFLNFAAFCWISLINGFVCYLKQAALYTAGY